jgi:DNA-binding MarR family transcriptional regulator
MAGNKQRANDAWEALLLAHVTLIKEFAGDDIWQDPSMREYDVLYTLSKCVAPIRISELNNHVLLSQPALSRLVDRLARRGMIKRQPDPADGRATLLSLTDAGRATQHEIGGRHARSVARALTARLSRDEIARLEAICMKLARQAVVSRVPYDESEGLS